MVRVMVLVPGPTVEGEVRESVPVLLADAAYVPALNEPVGPAKLMEKEAPSAAGGIKILMEFPEQQETTLAGETLLALSLIVTEN